MRHKEGNQRGAILITLIVSIVIMAVSASGMLYYSTTSSYGELLANRQQRAYYIGETGINYARYLFNPNTNYSGGPFPTSETFKLSNGQFTVKTYDKSGDNTRLIIESTGVVGSGWLTTRQLVTKEISKVEVAGSTTIEGEDGELIRLGEFDADSNSVLDTTWAVVEGDASDVSIEDGALEFKGNEGAITLNPSIVDLSTALENNGGLLGYFLQVKIDISKMSPGKYYMVGLSFRVQGADAQNSYGLSFYRSDGNNGPTTWYRTPQFDSLTSTLSKDGRVYVVLWKRVAGAFTVLAYAQMDGTAYGVLDYVSNKWILAQWVTLSIRVNEKFDAGDSGPSRNYMTAYVQHPSLYPLGTINWNYNNFKQITTWTIVQAEAGSSSTQVVDGTFTSKDFTDGQPEIGVHAFYDSFAEGAQLFGDVGTTIQGMGGGGSQW